MGGMQALDERWINIILPEFGINRSFEVEKHTYDRATGTCELEVRSVDASIDDWNASTEEGSQESSVLAISNTFTKVGTTLNPATEAAATVGQTILVNVSNNGGLGVPATPAGWQLAGGWVNSTMIHASFVRVIDGTEGSVTVNNVSGPITVVVFNGLKNPLIVPVSGAGFQPGTTASLDSVDVPSTPFVVAGAYAVNSNVNDPTVPTMSDGNKTPIDYHWIENRPGTITMNTVVTVIGTDMTPAVSGYGVINGVNTANFGTSIFFMYPGV